MKKEQIKKLIESNTTAEEIREEILSIEEASSDYSARYKGVNITLSGFYKANKNLDSDSASELGYEIYDKIGKVTSNISGVKDVIIKF